MLLGVVLIVLTLATSSLFFFPPVWFPAPIAGDAFAFDHQFSRTLWICGVIFLSLQVLLAVVIWRGNRLKSPAAGSHRRLEIGWTCLTAALFLSMALTGSRGWARMPGRLAAEEIIEVYTHQFAWNFRYPGPDRRFGATNPKLISDAGGNPLGIDPADQAGDDDTVTASLRVPAGREVLLLLHSRDVIHDFFVRELRTKQDIVPGMEIPLAIRADAPGTYEIACAELCGLGHSQMRSLLIVMPARDYDAWKASVSKH